MASFSYHELEPDARKRYEKKLEIRQLNGCPYRIQRTRGKTSQKCGLNLNGPKFMII